MSKLIDITEQKFGRLIVLKYKGKSKYGHSVWLCKCVCGNKKIINKSSLTSGGTKSCGCLQKEMVKLYKKEKPNFIHGMSHTTFHNKWCSMIERCYNPNHPAYHNYGGRGIKICEKWLDFINFKEDMYESYLEHKKNNDYTSIEREDNNGNYCKENCRWATRAEQSSNRRNSHLITYKKETLSLKEWSKKINIKYNILHSRIFRSKWPIKKALTMPVRTYAKNNNKKRN